MSRSFEDVAEPGILAAPFNCELAKLVEGILLACPKHNLSQSWKPIPIFLTGHTR